MKTIEPTQCILFSKKSTGLPLTGAAPFLRIPGRKPVFFTLVIFSNLCSISLQLRLTQTQMFLS